MKNVAVLWKLSVLSPSQPTPPKAVVYLPIDPFDGLDTYEDLPRDGRCGRDMWF